MIVLFSNAFETGNLNTDFFQDVPYLNDIQIELLLNFVECVEKGFPLKGRNKTSWQDRLGNEIPDTELYKQNNCWHYHCGPYNQDLPDYYTVNLELNLSGLTSSAVLHYQKLDEHTIFLLAYSPKHIPFPKSSDIGNPVLGRLN